MKNILIALDGSDLSETVLPVALTIANKCHYEPILLSVWDARPEEGTESVGPAVADLIARGTEYLQSYLHTLVPQLDRLNLPVTTEVRAGHPAVEIIGAARDREASLIAVSTHGPHAVAEKRRGSIADKVLRGAEAPVLAIGPTVSLPSSDPPIPIRRILVPLDGSAEAEQALPLALDLAKDLHSELHMVRVVTPVTGNYGVDVSDQLAHELNRDRERTARSYLESVRSNHKDRVISTQTMIGFPASALAQFVEESDIDLVVMTSHSRYASALWTLGRVADALLDGPAPVILVKPA